MLRLSVPYPAGHLFRLGIAVLLLTANCILMRVTSSITVLCMQDTNRGCRASPGTCQVSALSVLGSALPASAATLAGAFGIAAAKRPARCAFAGAIACGCPLMTLSLVLAWIFNGLRHGFHIVPVLVPDVIELGVFSVVNVLTFAMSAICVKTLLNTQKSASSVVTVGTLTAARTSCKTLESAEPVTCSSTVRLGDSESSPCPVPNAIPTD